MIQRTNNLKTRILLAVIVAVLVVSLFGAFSTIYSPEWVSLSLKIDDNTLGATPSFTLPIRSLTYQQRRKLKTLLNLRIVAIVTVLDCGSSINTADECDDELQERTEASLRNSFLHLEYLVSVWTDIGDLNDLTSEINT